MKNLTYRPLEPASLTDCRLLARWENDPEIRRFVRPFRDAEDFGSTTDPEAIRKHHLTEPRPSHAFVDLMVLWEDHPVGSASIWMDPPHQLTMKPGTAWYGILIGEAHARGKGIGFEAVRHLEALSRAAGARQAEVGIFAYNTASLRLFEKLGYRKFGSIPEFTWWDGRYWDDLRFGRALSEPR